MKKILIVDDEQPIRDLLQLLIESEFDNEIVLCESGSAAQTSLSGDDNIGIIISDYNMPDGNGGELFLFNEREKKLPFILLTGGFLEDYPEMSGFLSGTGYFRSFVPKPFEEEMLFDQIKTGLEETQGEKDSNPIATGEHSEYVRVDIELFLRQLRSYSLDLFLKLKDDKMVKVFSAGDVIEDEDLLKYKRKNQHEIFLRYDDFQKMKVELMQSIFSQLKNASSVTEAFDATGNAMSFMMVGSKILNIWPDQVKLVESSVESCLRNLESTTELADFLKSFNKDEGYLIAHSMTTLHLCFMVMKKGGFYTSENMERLSYAALIHDCELSDSSHSTVIDKNSEKFKALSSREQESILGHPIRGAECALKLGNIPDDVDMLIRFHHERPDGSGFPRGVNRNSFSVLSATLVLCLRVADFLFYNDDSSEKLVNYVNSLEDNYAQGAFKSPWNALKDIVN